uniref:Uncharacterized protein n=1 Tax=Mycena chlorophos TaxID=658473 RepID=A0ABQ0LMA7_MYCCL|nr:predicted protein [Mycena chlorophos]
MALLLLDPHRIKRLHLNLHNTSVPSVPAPRLAASILDGFALDLSGITELRVSCSATSRKLRAPPHDESFQAAIQRFRRRHRHPEDVDIQVDGW